jgi:hypothetical protein
MNTLSKPGTRAKIHSEATRKAWLVGSNGMTGAVNRLVEKGGAKVIGFWEVLEDPPAVLGFPTKVGNESGNPPLSSDFGYGFIGSGLERSDPSYRLYGTDYSRELFRLKGTRNFGVTGSKRPSSTTRNQAYKAKLDHWSSYQWPQKRQVACALKKIWAPTKSQQGRWTPSWRVPTAADPAPDEALPAC